MSYIIENRKSGSEAEDATDIDNDYCYMLAARLVNYQVLHELATSFPIFTSFRSFPRLKDIEKQYSICASNPYASAKLLKCIVAENQNQISKFLNNVRNACQNPTRIDSALNEILFDSNKQFQFALDIEKKLKTQEETLILMYLEVKGKVRS